MPHGRKVALRNEAKNSRRLQAAGSGRLRRKIRLISLRFSSQAARQIRPPFGDKANLLPFAGNFEWLLFIWIVLAAEVCGNEGPVRRRFSSMNPTPAFSVRLPLVTACGDRRDGVGLDGFKFGIFDFVNFGTLPLRQGRAMVFNFAQERITTPLRACDQAIKALDLVEFARLGW